MQCLYLNNSGHRWVIPGNMSFILRYPNGMLKGRTADYYEAWGNLALVCFRIKGKRIKAFFNDHDKYEGLPIVDVKPEWLLSDKTNHIER